MPAPANREVRVRAAMPWPAALRSPVTGVLRAPSRQRPLGAPQGELPAAGPTRAGRGGARRPEGGPTADGVTLWDFPEMTRRAEFAAFERRDVEPMVVFSDDSSTLATVDRDVVTLWDVDDRAAITTLTEGTAPTGIAIAPDNRTVALAVAG